MADRKRKSGHPSRRRRRLGNLENQENIEVNNLAWILFNKIFMIF
jgi:hypothetical protein